MNKHKLFFYIIFGFIINLSCQKDVFLDLPPYESKLVVYALLKADTFPGVYLTQSVTIYEPQDYAELGINDATVILETDSLNDTLMTGDSLPKGTYYSFKQKIKNQEIYRLKIRFSNGKEYSGVSRVPGKSPLDSVSVKTFITEEKDTLFIPYFYFKPILVNSFYSVHYFRNGKIETGEPADTNKVKLKKYEPSLDGLPFKFFNDNQSSKLYIMRKGFVKGDTARIFFRHLNEDYYNYLITSYQNSESGEPVKIKSNIPVGLGVLGSFSDEEVTFIF